MLKLLWSLVVALTFFASIIAISDVARTGDLLKFNDSILKEFQASVSPEYRQAAESRAKLLSGLFTSKMANYGRVANLCLLGFVVSLVGLVVQFRAPRKYGSQ